MKYPPRPIPRPIPPPSRVEYRGALSSFFGPEDEFERWKASPRQRVIAKLEPLAMAALPVSIALALLGGVAVRIWQAFNA